MELPAPRALEGRRREVRAAQRAILWVPSLRSTRTSEWTFWTFLGLFRCTNWPIWGPLKIWRFLVTKRTKTTQNLSVENLAKKLHHCYLPNSLKVEGFQS